MSSIKYKWYEKIFLTSLHVKLLISAIVAILVYTLIHMLERNNYNLLIPIIYVFDYVFITQISGYLFVNEKNVYWKRLSIVSALLIPILIFSVFKLFIFSELTNTSIVMISCGSFPVVILIILGCKFLAIWVQRK